MKFLHKYIIDPINDSTLLKFVFLANSISYVPLQSLSNFFNKLYPLRNTNPWIISGSPRSGTTWLAEIIAASYQNNRLIWEPFSNRNQKATEAGFNKRYLFYSKDEYNIERNKEKFIHKLLKGEMLNFFTLGLWMYPTNIGSVLKKGKLIIKCVEGNGIVGYLHNKYNIPKPVIIIRHPCAVIASQMRMGTWDDHPHIDPKLLQVYPKIGELMNNANSLKEKLAITWAGDVLAAKLFQNDVQVVYYEDLVLNGNIVLKEIFAEWGVEDVPEPCIKKLESMSKSSRYWSENNSGMAKLKSWTNYLSENDIKNIFKIIKFLDIKDYEENNYLPVKR
ncbi:sulfotransferase [Methanohalophilus portucalensis]|uniref:Sulfotransferase family protein n=2 Tax=Methanohalophilus portucalensis TaxID=39664 RepID=A0A1X7P2T0_9EURY|nr:sulfotransferase [Methanohalophilus portucalensis]ATU08087.1 hypothetical protein BKM01_04425 [Methanohalophilus portucalensis]RNI10063.1 hypothetical protein EFE41_08385 [Methanohalophilus portucalensis FDF-1]SMH44443.1 Sulfotransferase family protein [Methanohalophilus portucalensis FDF-1]